jgi:hypothetical protein
MTMSAQRIVSGTTEEEIWSWIGSDINRTKELITYEAVIRQGGLEVQLGIDIDLGGGFEGGIELTRFKAQLPADNTFRFALHHQGFIDAIGKFFGMQDLETGDKEFDDRVVIKTNNPERLPDLFADESVRRFLGELESFDMGVHSTHLGASEPPYLDLNIDEGITDPKRLQHAYHCFYTLLQKLH